MSLVGRTLHEIAEEVRRCRKCPLYRTRKNAVPGEGPAPARFFLLGEAPGKKEDETGRPFVGVSGRFLDRMLEEHGLSRDEFFITGTVKCRPPNNRTPTRREVEACLPYTLEQVRAVDPEVILLAGNTAVNAILGKGFSVSRHSGRVMTAEVAGRKRKVIIAPHPAAAMRFPRMRILFQKALRELEKVA